MQAGKKKKFKNTKIIKMEIKKLLTDDMTVYGKNAKKTTKKLLELSSNHELSNVKGHQINTEKSFVFPYTSNKLKIKSKKLSFTIKAKPPKKCTTCTLKSQNTSQRNYRRPK